MKKSVSLFCLVFMLLPYSTAFADIADMPSSSESTGTNDALTNGNSVLTTFYLDSTSRPHIFTVPQDSTSLCSGDSGRVVEVYKDTDETWKSRCANIATDGPNYATTCLTAHYDDVNNEAWLAAKNNFDGNIYFYKRAEGSTSWGSAVGSVNTSSNFNGHYCKMDIGGPNNRVLAIIRNTTSSSFATIYDIDSGGFSQKTNQSLGPRTMLDIEVDSTGNVHTTFGENDNLRYRKWNYGTEIWDAVEIIPTYSVRANTYEAGAIAVHPTQDIVKVFFDGDDDIIWDREILEATRTSGTWNTPQVIRAYSNSSHEVFDAEYFLNGDMALFYSEWDDVGKYGEYYDSSWHFKSSSYTYLGDHTANHRVHMKIREAVDGTEYSHIAGGSDEIGTYMRYLTNMPEGAGDPVPPSVPEYKTYIYIITLILGLGLMHTLKPKIVKST